MSYIGKSPIPVVIGGTGDTTLTSHGVLLGEGTAAIQATATGTAGQALLGQGASTNPSYVTPTAGSNLSVTTNATTLSYAIATVPITEANGGTGANSLTAASLLASSNLSIFTAIGAATNGQIPIGSTGAFPNVQPITPGSGITVTNGAGSITISSPGAITTINGNSGSVTGSTVTITTGASGANGTAKFFGSAPQLILRADGFGLQSVGIGVNSLSSVSLSGTNNTCMGDNSGKSITSGSTNTLLGYQAGATMTTQSSNTYAGYDAGFSGTTGTGQNCIMGYQTGYGITTAFNNVMMGNSNGGASLTTGSYNAIVGAGAGSGYNGAESSNVLINNYGTAGNSNVLNFGYSGGAGNEEINAAFISGITGITVTGVAMLVSGSGQLGVASSSKRFKKNIKNMGKGSEAIYKLRPVTFKWKKGSAPGLKEASSDRQFGLIAEEVSKVLPSIVTYDSDNKPLSVRYNELFSLMINELKKLTKRVEYLESL